MAQKVAFRVTMTLEITPANEPYMNPTTSSPRTPTPKENASLFEFFLCLSRACLGKKMISI